MLSCLVMTERTENNAKHMSYIYHGSYSLKVDYLDGGTPPLPLMDNTLKACISMRAFFEGLIQCCTCTAFYQ